MRATRLMLSGVAISAIAVAYPAKAREGLTLDNSAKPFVVAQQDKNQQDQKKKQEKGNREQGGDQKKEQRQEGRGQERQQGQDSRKPQKEQTDKGQERKPDGASNRDQSQERQDLRKQQGQQQQKRQQEQQQRDQRKDAKEEQRNDQRKDRREGAKEQRQDRREDAKDERKDRREDAKDQRKDQREDAKDNRQDRQDANEQRKDRQDSRDDRARRLDDIKGERRERREGNRTIIQEGSRTIIRDGNRTIIRRDESDRFRRFGRDVNVQRVGGETRTVVVGPNGQRIITVTDANGRLLRRSRYVNDREVIIIDNRPRGGRGADAFFVALPALAIASLAIPRDRYIVEAESAPPEYIYGALMAPPVERLPRAYTLDEIRYSPEVRDRMPRIDLDTITFDSGSWEISPDQYSRLAPIAEGIKRAIAKSPNEVFLVEGHTDATGSEEDNLSLSDRRAEAVSIILTDQFQIPPENLTTQGYGEQQLKIATEGPERANRRVTMRRITPLLQQGQAAGGPAPQ